MRFEGKKAYKQLCKGLKKWLKENTWTEYYRGCIEECDERGTYEIKIYARPKKSRSS